MSLSQLGRSIAESPTLKLNEQANALRAKGEAVIHLGGGQPTNKAPISAVLSSAAKLKDGHVKYTPSDGTPSLKRAIIRYTEDNYGRHVEPENVIVSTGAKQSVYNVLLSIVDPQDEVILSRQRMGRSSPGSRRLSRRSAPARRRSSSTARITPPV